MAGLEDRHGVISSLDSLGLLAMDRGNLDLAATMLEECLAFFRESEDGWEIARSLHNLGTWPTSGVISISRRHFKRRPSHCGRGWRTSTASPTSLTVRGKWRGREGSWTWQRCSSKRHWCCGGSWETNETLLPHS